MLIQIPVISPIEVSVLPRAAKLLSAPEPEQPEIAEADYTVDEEPSEPIEAITSKYGYVVASPALVALNQLEHAAAHFEYHDPQWWAERFNLLRDIVKRAETPPPEAVQNTGQANVTPPASSEEPPADSLEEQ